MFKATCENPIKNDFVKFCERYLKNLVKEKASLAYLIAEKNKQTKIAHIQYENFELQEYLLDGNENVNVSKFIFKARSSTLDIKTQRKWKYDDKACTGCKVRDETGDEILSCWYFGNEKLTKLIHYDMFYGESTNDMNLVAKIMMEKLKRRKHIIDTG